MDPDLVSRIREKREEKLRKEGITYDVDMEIDQEADSEEACSDDAIRKGQKEQFCTLCRTKFFDTEEYSEHQFSLRHCQYLEKEKGQTIHHCPLCNYEGHGIQNFESHLLTSAHKANLLGLRMWKKSVLGMRYQEPREEVDDAPWQKHSASPGLNRKAYEDSPKDPFLRDTSLDAGLLGGEGFRPDEQLNRRLAEFGEDSSQDPYSSGRYRVSSPDNLGYHSDSYRLDRHSGQGWRRSPDPPDRSSRLDSNDRSHRHADEFLTGGPSLRQHSLSPNSRIAERERYPAQGLDMFGHMGRSDDGNSHKESHYLESTAGRVSLDGLTDKQRQRLITELEARLNRRTRSSPERQAEQPDSRGGSTPYDPFTLELSPPHRSGALDDGIRDPFAASDVRTPRSGGDADYDLHSRLEKDIRRQDARSSAENIFMQRDVIPGLDLPDETPKLFAESERERSLERAMQTPNNRDLAAVREQELPAKVDSRITNRLVGPRGIGPRTPPPLPEPRSDTPEPFAKNQDSGTKPRSPKDRDTDRHTRPRSPKDRDKHSRPRSPQDRDRDRRNRPRSPQDRDSDRRNRPRSPQDRDRDRRNRPRSPSDRDSDRRNRPRSPQVRDIDRRKRPRSPQDKDTDRRTRTRSPQGRDTDRRGRPRSRERDTDRRTRSPTRESQDASGAEKEDRRKSSTGGETPRDSSDGTTKTPQRSDSLQVSVKAGEVINDVLGTGDGLDGPGMFGTPALMEQWMHGFGPFGRFPPPHFRPWGPGFRPRGRWNRPMGPNFGMRPPWHPSWMRGQGPRFGRGGKNGVDIAEEPDDMTKKLMERREQATKILEKTNAEHRSNEQRRDKDRDRDRDNSAERLKSKDTRDVGRKPGKDEQGPKFARPSKINEEAERKKIMQLVKAPRTLAERKQLARILRAHQQRLNSQMRGSYVAPAGGRKPSSVLDLSHLPRDVHEQIKAMVDQDKDDSLGSLTQEDVILLEQLVVMQGAENQEKKPKQRRKADPALRAAVDSDSDSGMDSLVIDLGTEDSTKPVELKTPSGGSMKLSVGDSKKNQLSLSFSEDSSSKRRGSQTKDELDGKRRKFGEREWIKSDLEDVLSKSEGQKELRGYTALLLTLHEEDVYQKVKVANAAIIRLDALLRRTQAQLRDRQKERQKMMDDLQRLRSRRIRFIKASGEETSEVADVSSIKELALPNITNIDEVITSAKRPYSEEIETESKKSKNRKEEEKTEEPPSKPESKNWFNKYITKYSRKDEETPSRGSSHRKTHERAEKTSQFKTSFKKKPDGGSSPTHSNASTKSKKHSDSSDKKRSRLAELAHRESEKKRSHSADGHRKKHEEAEASSASSQKSSEKEKEETERKAREKEREEKASSKEKEERVPKDEDQDEREEERKPLDKEPVKTEEKQQPEETRQKPVVESSDEEGDSVAPSETKRRPGRPKKSKPAALFTDSDSDGEAAPVADSWKAAVFKEEDDNDSAKEGKKKKEQDREEEEEEQQAGGAASSGSDSALEQLRAELAKLKEKERRFKENIPAAAPAPAGDNSNSGSERRKRGRPPKIRVIQDSDDSDEEKSAGVRAWQEKRRRRKKNIKKASKLVRRYINAQVDSGAESDSKTHKLHKKLKMYAVVRVKPVKVPKSSRRVSVESKSSTTGEQEKPAVQPEVPAPNSPEHVKPKDEDVVPKDEAVVSKDKDVVPKDEAVVSKDEEVAPKDKAAVSKDEAVVSKDEDVVPKDEAAVSKDEEVVAKGEGAVPKEEVQPTAQTDGDATPGPEPMEVDQPEAEGVKTNCIDLGESKDTTSYTSGDCVNTNNSNSSAKSSGIASGAGDKSGGGDMDTKGEPVRSAESCSPTQDVTKDSEDTRKEAEEERPEASRAGEGEVTPREMNKVLELPSPACTGGEAFPTLSLSISPPPLADKLVPLDVDEVRELLLTGDGSKSPPPDNDSPRAPPAATTTDLPVGEGATRRFVGHEGAVNAITVWKNYLLTASEDSTARRFNLETGECLAVYKGHSASVQDVVISPVDDNRINVFTGSFDNTVLGFNMETSMEVCRHKFAHRVFCLHRCANTLYVGLGNGRVICIDLKLDTVTDMHRFSETAIKCIASGQRGDTTVVAVAAADGTVSLRGTASSELLGTLNVHSKAPMSMQIYDGRLLTCAADKTVKVHDLSSEECLQTIEQKGVMTCLCVLDGVLMAAGYEGLARCYDLKTYKLQQLYYGAGKDVIMAMAAYENKIITANREGLIEANLIDREKNWTCKFDECGLVFGLSEHLKHHLLSEHVRPDVDTIRCEWQDCGEMLSTKEGCQETADHLNKHVENEVKSKS